MVILDLFSHLKALWSKLREDQPLDLLMWRNHFARVMSAYGAIFFPLGMVYTLPFLIAQGRYGPISVDVACWFLMLIHVLFLRPSVKVSRYLLLAIPYIMAISFLVSLGPNGARSAWLVLCSVFAGIFFGIRGAIVASILNAVILWALYGLMGPGNNAWAPVYAEPMANWLLIAMNTPLLALVSGLAVAFLLNRLERSLRDQVDATETLRKRSRELERTYELLRAEVEQRNIVEKASKKSEAQYHLLAENVTDVIWTMDMALNVSYMSPSVYRTRGYTQEEAMALKLTDHLIPESLTLVTRILAEELAIEASGERDLKRSRRVELGFLRKDGSTFWGEANFTFIRDSEGKAIGILGVSRDINDRRRAEEALRESEKEARRVAKEALAMAEIGRIMSSTLTIEEVYESFAAVAGKLIPFDRIVINMIDSESHTLRNVYIAGGEISDRKLDTVYHLEGSGNAEMLRTKSTFLLQPDDFAEYKDRYPNLRSTFEAGFRSILNVPLLSRGEVIGGLLFRSYKPGAYRDEDVRLAERIANQIAGAVANAQMFTKQKQAEEALREAERKYRELVRYAPAAICEVDLKTGLFTSVNDGMCEVTGYSREELLAMNPSEILDKESQDRRRERLSKLLSGKEPGNQVEYRVQTKRGHTRDALFRISFQTDESGRPACATVVGHDITERKQMERALRESEERFRQVAENVSDFIWEVDTQGQYLYTSPSVERILGYTPDELVGKKRYYDLFIPDVRERLKEGAIKVLAARQSFRNFSNPNLSKEGKLVHLETSGAPVLDASGDLIGYRGAATDVTERKRAEEELRSYQEHLEELVTERTAELEMAMERAEAANRAKSAFLANMSHELRTPLNSILGVAQLLMRDREFPPQQRELLGILSRSSQHLFELIDDILQMSRIEAGYAAVVAESFDMHLLLNEVGDMLRGRAEKKGLRLTLVWDPGLPRHIFSDGPKIRQILLNFLSNAIKFTERGHITLRAMRQRVAEEVLGGPSRAQVEFEVEDTGIGIAPEDLDRIFDTFFQVNSMNKPNVGVGLGLAISRKLAAMLGGEITVRSEVGRGSAFRLKIPIQQIEHPDIVSQTVVRRVTGFEPGQPSHCLLVVDDNLESRIVLRQFLEPVGFKVIEAGGGLEAIKLFRDRRPHLVWMDIRMPEMGGYEAARIIREVERGMRDEDGREMHTPIIAYTAGAMENRESPLFRGVFDDWVYKPFREKELFEILVRHLGVRFVYESYQH